MRMVRLGGVTVMTTVISCKIKRGYMHGVLNLDFSKFMYLFAC